MSESRTESAGSTPAPTNASPAAAPGGGDPPYPPIKYAWYVVGVLMLVYVFSFIDRQILSLLVDPIKRDLGITEVQMSYLMGLSFAIFYTFFGIPLGRLADSKSRRMLIAFGVAFWSLMTAGCGVVHRYWQFAVMRMGVGVGEATLGPSAFSLITDYFPKEKLGTAISVYSAGIYIGSGMAFLLGGMVVKFASGQEGYMLPLVGEIHAWQLVFFCVGFPGILLSLLMLTVREPFRRGVRRNAAGATAQEPLSAVLRYIGANWKTFSCHTLGFAFLSFSAYGSSSWIPTYFVRVHGWERAYTGIVYGTTVMIFGTLGISVGGIISDRLARKGKIDSKMRVGLYASVLWIFSGLYFPIVESANLALLLMIPTVFFTAMPFGVAPAAIQEMMPNNMRGQASAVYLFVVNLIGLGLGPTAVAMMTQHVFRSDYAVGLSLASVALVAHLISAALLLAGLRHFRESLDYLRQWNER